MRVTFWSCTGHGRWGTLWKGLSYVLHIHIVLLISIQFSLKKNLTEVMTNWLPVLPVPCWISSTSLLHTDHSKSMWQKVFLNPTNFYISRGHYSLNWSRNFVFHPESNKFLGMFFCCFSNNLGKVGLNGYAFPGHHPDLHLVGWNNVKIDAWTHWVSKLKCSTVPYGYFDFRFHSRMISSVTSVNFREKWSSINIVYY